MVLVATPTWHQRSPLTSTLKIASTYYQNISKQYQHSRSIVFVTWRGVDPDPFVTLQQTFHLRQLQPFSPIERRLEQLKIEASRCRWCWCYIARENNHFLNGWFMVIHLKMDLYAFSTTMFNYLRVSYSMGSAVPSEEVWLGVMHWLHWGVICPFSGSIWINRHSLPRSKNIKKSCHKSWSNDKTQ